MKLLHLADLHLGKRYNELSLIDDQKYILDEILKIADGEKPDGIILAGDIYDKSVPSAEAVELFDKFLTELKDRNLQVFAISGNHDSAERIAFGACIMSGGGVHFSPVYDGTVKSVTLTDEYGDVNVYLLPFIKPSAVRRFFGGEKIESYTDAVKCAVNAMNIDFNKRNVLIAHQFVTGSQEAGSEEFSVGDIGNVDASVFSGFDYVALGHIHRAQNVGSERLRYSGTPLKYSLSEAGSSKSVTVVELNEKGSLTVREIPLIPMREVVEIRGTYAELTAKSFYGGTTYPRDLVHIVLTDEDEVIDAVGKLRIIYPNLMSVRYDNKRTAAAGCDELLKSVPNRSPYELFNSLFVAQNNAEMTGEQEKLVRGLIEKVWGDGQ